MTYLNGKEFTYRQGDRLFDSMWQLLQLIVGLGVSQISMATGKLTDEANGAYYSTLFDTCLLYPIKGVVTATLRNITPHMLSIRVDSLPNFPPSVQTKKKQNFEDLFDLCASVVFVNFYENYKDFMDQKWQNDLTKWPNVINFARVIRNAISHSGNLYIKGQNSPPVSWYTLTYSYADMPRKIIGEDMSCSDIVFLMMEMSDALDTAGAPIIL